ncbi:MAG: membrane dipeptidase [Rhodospirillales bacterium]|nr:membrane dipeptidase [Rhodospirillales bacterium]
MIEIHLPDDIRAAKAEGGHGVLIAIEGGDFLEGRLERIEEAHERGVRSIQLVHNRINALGDIQTKPPEHRGLTPFGRQVVREMNRLGLIVDVAHLSFEGMREVIEVADKPIMLSHGMLGQGGRAISDDYARAVAATGGVIGLFSAGERTLGGYLDRFRRLADLIGAEHVGFGSDMGSYGPFYVFKNYRDLPALVAGLLQRGFNEAEVAGIIGGNFLRMFDAVSAASAA